MINKSQFTLRITINQGAIRITESKLKKKYNKLQNLERCYQQDKNLIKKRQIAKSKLSSINAPCIKFCRKTQDKELKSTQI